MLYPVELRDRHLTSDRDSVGLDLEITKRYVAGESMKAIGLNFGIDEAIVWRTIQDTWLRDLVQNMRRKG